jgi:preprotein translocase subunit SecY
MEDEEKKGIESKIARFLPSVEKPTYRQSFNAKLKWTGIALLAYLVLSYITVYGHTPSSQLEATLTLQTLLGAKFGTLMTLGIGPIVTAGIILQLLVGSKIINWSLTEPEGRKKFDTWNKFLAIILCFAEGVLYVLAGAVQVTGGIGLMIFVVLQLAVGGIIVILLDEIVSKWGFGSGISLFIAVGVANQIFIRVLTPFAICQVADVVKGGMKAVPCLPSSGNPPRGLLWDFFISALAGDLQSSLLVLMPLLTTVGVFLIVVFVQNVGIDIPLSFTTLRGFGRSWNLKLLYTSNIPVILATSLIASAQMMGRMGMTQQGNLSCSLLACVDSTGNVVSGVLYYLTSPRNLLGDFISGTLASSEIVRGVTYLISLTTMTTLFSILWINTSGMDAGSVAEQIESIGMQIPGYRSDKRTMEQVLNKYIPSLAVLGGLVIGVLAAFADFVGAIGSGTGILLTVMIIYNYYEQLSAENLDEAHPMIKKFLGE